ncbi:40947_t:CDS:2 [Gigaspora margarita]|uniref:40947_t:CDS:1 n=1 Tax=Gigaspora margarita TaxID=4874 RepID=A0ABN7VAX5_GIGMA|nr:40947_t:CDS:2 [Gigaspora margarita]
MSKVPKLDKRHKKELDKLSNISLYTRQKKYKDAWPLIYNLLDCKEAHIKSEAEYFAAEYYLYGHNIEKDEEKAHYFAENLEKAQEFEKALNIFNKISQIDQSNFKKSIGGSEDKNKASELYKVAADKGITWAQLRYAFSIKDEDIPTFIKYLNQSAKNGNSMAQSNLGYIYFYSKFNIPVDNEKGKKLLILAAKKNDAQSIQLCIKERINYLDQINSDNSVTDKKIY